MLKKSVENKQLDCLIKRGIINNKGIYETIRSDKDLAIKLLQNKKCREALSIKDKDLSKSDITIDEKRGLTAYERTLEKVTRNINSDLHRPYSTNLNYVKAYCILFDCSADYLLGIEKERNHDLHFICNYTGLSVDAIDCLHMLHTPSDPSCTDSMQDSRYDIIALNIILEDLYTNLKNKEEWEKFSPDSILNQIGQYIDSNSINFLKATTFSQNGKTEIFPYKEMFREMFKSRILDSLKYLHEKYSLYIPGKRNENKEYFKKCFEDYIRSFYNEKS